MAPPDHDKRAGSSNALAKAIEDVLADTAREAMLAAVQTLSVRLAEVEEHVIADTATQTAAGKETAEKVLQRLTDLNIDVNHALVTLTQNLAGTHQRLNQVETSIGERVSAIQEKLVAGDNALVQALGTMEERVASGDRSVVQAITGVQEKLLAGDKALDERLIAASKQLNDATNKFGLARQDVDKHHAAVESALQSINKSISAISSRLVELEEIGKRLSVLEPRVEELVPKIDAAPLAVRALDDRLNAVERAQARAATGIDKIRIQSIVLISLVAALAVGLVAALVR